jgi:L-ascorbate metabolism protein UlaG (beta-lactamase superfamily)
VADVVVEWFGCTTYRVRCAGRTLLIDAYVDKVPGALPLGIGPADLGPVDLVFVSHAHFDHMADAGAVAELTGAPVVGNPETVAVLRAGGTPTERLLPVTGGETVDCGAGLRMRVLPALHSCLFAASSVDSGESCIGDLDVPVQRRLAAVEGLFAMLGSMPSPEADYFASVAPRSSTRDGGQLGFLLETPTGSILFSNSSGCWTGLYRELRPDVAILALSGRPNLDGEPFQGSLAGFLTTELALLKPTRFALSHTDALVPSVIGPVDTGDALSAAQREASYAQHLPFTYCEPLAVF